MPIVPRFWALHGVASHNFNYILDGKIIYQPEVVFGIPVDGLRAWTTTGDHTVVSGYGSVRFGALSSEQLFRVQGLGGKLNSGTAPPVELGPAHDE